MVTSIVPTRFCPFLEICLFSDVTGVGWEKNSLQGWSPASACSCQRLFHPHSHLSIFSGPTINIYDHKSTMGNQHQRHFHASHSYLAVFSRPTIHIIIIIMSTSWGISLAFLGLSFVYRLILGISLEHVYILDGESWNSCFAKKIICSIQETISLGKGNSPLKFYRKGKEKSGL